jgi:hypothetical protein
MRLNPFIFSLLVLFAGQNNFVRAQSPANPTADQLMQIARSQPAVDISAPVTATAEFDPPLVRPGEKSVYRVTFNATAVSVNWPEKIPAPPALQIRLNTTGQTMQFAGGGYQNFASFDYDVRASAAGSFTVPEYTAEVYGKSVVVPVAVLEVKTDLPEPHEPARELFVEPSATNVFVGEMFKVSVRLPATASGAVEGVSDVQFNGGGFVADKNAARQSIQMARENGRRVPVYVYETGITPITSGPLNLSAQGFTVEMPPGGAPKYILLDSEPAVINVRPLPAESELPGFTGMVGSFAGDPPSLVTNTLKVGEPVQLTVVIRGGQNLDRIIPPPAPRAEGWQIFPAERGGIIGGNGVENPGATFKYTLIPLTDDLRATPAIPFSCFDPAAGKYLDLTVPSLPVTVVANGTATNGETSLMLSENTSEPEKETGLSKLAPSPGLTTGSLVPLQLRGGFLVIELLPAPGFFALWLWDRHRRFLEQHPEIARCRQARRALRREVRLLEQAAAKNDVAEFVRRAVNSLQIASAPHYPATPRALVCGDVLEILTPAERAGKSGETVRRFFAAADAVEFANSTETKIELLAEKPALKEILLKLEARL